MISFAQAIERRVDNIRTEEKEKRPDLYALATGYVMISDYDGNIIYVIIIKFYLYHS
jgi:hypothetical protein